MKAFVLGGYGKVGFPAMKLIAQSDLITEVAVAGRNLERIEKAAREIGEKAIAVYADGTDEEKLATLVAGYDIIMNAAYDGTVLPAIRAGIRAGTHYCDVNGVIEQALQLSSEAKAAGITSIVANGIGPCITNLMGVHVARQLEQVEQLQLGFASIFNWESGRELTPQQWLKDPTVNLAVLHEFKPFISMIMQILQKKGIRAVLDYHDGQWVEVDPIRRGLDVPLPQGGLISSYPYASSDPLWESLPRDLSSVRPVEVFFSPLPPQLHDLLREQALRVLEDNIDPNTAINSFFDTVDSDPHRWLIPPDDFIPVPKIWVRAVGYKENYTARFSCWFTAPMWNIGGYFLTSAALAVGVLKILRGEVRERGVLTAEKAFEPKSFFNEIYTLLPEARSDGRLIEESFEWLDGER